MDDIMLLDRNRVIQNVMVTILLIIAAWGVDRSSSLGWGGAWAADSTRYKVSPVGISHVLQPRTTVSPTVWAGWVRESGDAALRTVAPGGDSAYARLKLTYPLLRFAFWLALLGAVVIWIPVRILKNRVFVILFLAGSSFAALAGVALFITNAQPALVVLIPVDFGYGGTLGVMLVSASPLLCLLAIVLLFLDRFWIFFTALFLAAWYFDVRFIGSIHNALVITFLLLPFCLTIAITIIAQRKTTNSTINYAN